MFFFLSKLFAFLEMPIVWVTILLVLAIADKRPLRKRKWLISALCILYLFSNAFLFDLVIHSWESEPVNLPANAQPYDVAIVLSGVINYDSQHDRLQFMRRSDRLMKAVELYKLGKVKKILITGGNGSMENGVMHENQRLVPLLEELGIPKENVLIEGSSGNTRENAMNSKRILDRDFPGGRFLLFTSGYHIPRAVRCFEKAGVHVDPYPTDLYSGRFKIEIGKMFVPNAETLFNWEVLTHEWIGFLTYRILGYC